MKPISEIYTMTCPDCKKAWEVIQRGGHHQIFTGKPCECECFSEPATETQMFKDILLESEEQQ